MSLDAGAISVVLPARNESPAIGRVVTELVRLLPDAEIIVVDDGSTDDTASVARAAGARVVSHPYSKGNGAAVKTGARTATRDIVVFMDADGQHPPAEVPGLVGQLRDQGLDMVVGARDAAGQASAGRHA
ncbi:MAG: glycosyltransferase family 2 protein, partial [Gammaproteobacteria bacterium]